MSISSNGQSEFDSHTTTKYKIMEKIKENNVKLLTNEVLTKQLLKLYKNRIKIV